ncbi:MAG: ArsR/SmtB family transcription factor [Chitinophagales bacterium]
MTPVAAMDSERLKRIASILKAVAHPIRLGIIELLDQNKRLSVSQICTRLQSEQSLTSHNLKNMRLQGILVAERDGKNVFYSLKVKDIPKIIDCLENCACQF